MSWGVKAVGTKGAVQAELEKQFDAAAKTYEGTEEEKDVLAVKERALAAVSTFEPSNYLNGLDVDANGSRSSGYVGFKLQVTPIRLVT